MRPKPNETGDVLVATLGSEAQVVSLALDRLLEKGEPIREVVVVHTAPEVEPIRSAYCRLNAEVLPYARREPPVTLRFEMIFRPDGAPVVDTATEEDAGAVFTTLYRLVKGFKRERRRVHLSVAGGRKVMSVYGMAVAQLLFEEDDCVWHVLSEGALLASKEMHASSAEGVTLIPIPVLRWSSLPPVYTKLAQTDDPYQAVQFGRRAMEDEAYRKRERFFSEVLTESERTLVEALMRTPSATNAALARTCHRSPRTVGNQLSAIYRKFAETFRVPSANRALLVSALTPVVEQQKGRNS